MAKVILKGHIIVPFSELEVILEELNKHIQLTKLEDDCLVFNVKQRPENSCYFDVYEEFTDQPAFEYHQQRVKQSTWGRISQNVERHYQTIIQS